MVLTDQLLNLRGRQDPADIKENVNVGRSRLAFKSSRNKLRIGQSKFEAGTNLLQLQELGGLHKTLHRQGTFAQVVRLAPFLQASNVVLNLHRWRRANTMSARQLPITNRST